MVPFGVRMRLRLASQRIENPTRKLLLLVDVARHLLATQAQDFIQVESSGTQESSFARSAARFARFRSG